MSYLYPQTLPPTACSTALRHHCVTPFPFVHKPNKRHYDRIAVSAGWDSWGKIVVLHDGFDAKRGARYRSVIYRPTPESTRTAMTARENYTRPLRRTRAAKYALLTGSFGNTELIKNAVNRAPAPQNPMPKQAFLAQNENENARRADRDLHDTFRTASHLPH
jgi:dynein light intermediate chain 1